MLDDLLAEHYCPACAALRPMDSATGAETAADVTGDGWAELSCVVCGTAVFVGGSDADDNHGALQTVTDASAGRVA